MMPMQSESGWPHIGTGLVATLVVVALVGAASLAIGWTVPVKSDKQPQLRIPRGEVPRLVTFPTKIDK